MGMSGISKSQVSALCKDIDIRVNSFLDRPREGEWPYIWLHATYLKTRENRRVVSVAAIIATGVNTKAAIAQVFKASWQRCRVHFMRNALAHVPKAQHQMVAAAIRSVFAQNTQAEGSKTWRHRADQLRARLPKLAALMDEADVVGIFPNEASIMRLVGTILLEQNDEWQ